MSSPLEPPLRRRTLLAASVPALAGCIIDVSSCSTGKSEFDTPAVSRFMVASGDGYVREGELCDEDSNNCLRIEHMEFDHTVVDRIEIRAPGGEVVRTHDADDGELSEFELGEFASRGSLERDVMLLDEDGGVIDIGGAHAECRL